ncbi:hypothetical protein JCM30394_18500 [Deferrisoma palaeochoriense]
MLGSWEAYPRAPRLGVRAILRKTASGGPSGPDRGVDAAPTPAPPAHGPPPSRLAA